MALEGCFTCIKYLMFAFNFLFWLLGCGIIGVGIWIKVHPETFTSAAQDTQLEGLERELSSYGFSNMGAYSLIAVGTFIMIIGFLGCCGAVKESQCMLGVFFMALFITFSSLVGIGIYSIIMKEELKQDISRELHKKLQNIKNDKSSQNLMRFIQEKFECCGIENGIEDYAEPPSPSYECAEKYKKKGCLEKMYEKYSQNIVIIAAVTVAIAAVLFVGMTFALLLCCAIREQSEGKIC